MKINANCVKNCDVTNVTPNYSKVLRCHDHIKHWSMEEFKDRDTAFLKKIVTPHHRDTAFLKKIVTPHLRDTAFPGFSGNLLIMHYLKPTSLQTGLRTNIFVSDTFY